MTMPARMEKAGEEADNDGDLFDDTLDGLDHVRNIDHGDGGKAGEDSGLYVTHLPRQDMHGAVPDSRHALQRVLREHKLAARVHMLAIATEEGDDGSRHGLVVHRKRELRPKFQVQAPGQVLVNRELIVRR